MKTSRKCFKLGAQRILWGKTSKAYSVKVKIAKLDFLRLRRFCLAKETFVRTGATELANDVYKPCN